MGQLSAEAFVQTSRAVTNVSGGTSYEVSMVGTTPQGNLYGHIFTGSHDEVIPTDKVLTVTITWEDDVPV